MHTLPTPPLPRSTYSSSTTLPRTSSEPRKRQREAPLMSLSSALSKEYYITQGILRQHVNRIHSHFESENSRGNDSQSQVLEMLQHVLLLFDWKLSQELFRPTY